MILQQSLQLVYKIYSTEVKILRVEDVPKVKAGELSRRRSWGIIKGPGINPEEYICRIKVTGTTTDIFEDVVNQILCAEVEFRGLVWECHAWLSELGTV